MLRRFNRSFTQRIGVLADSYLDTGRPLGPSRLLFELGRGAAGVGDLRRRLGLDSGYLSRMLRRLAHEDLVVVASDPSDGRQRIACLSTKGRREWVRLDQRSEKLARRLLDPLTARQRSELAAALATADRLLSVATVSVEIVDPGSRSAGRPCALLQRAGCALSVGVRHRPSRSGRRWRHAPPAARLVHRHEQR